MKDFLMYSMCAILLLGPVAQGFDSCQANEIGNNEPIKLQVSYAKKKSGAKEKKKKSKKDTSSTATQTES